MPYAVRLASIEGVRGLRLSVGVRIYVVGV